MKFDRQILADPKGDLFKTQSRNPIKEKRSNRRSRTKASAASCFSGGPVQTQEPKQREDWRRRREEYLRESGRHVELIKEGYEYADSSNGWAVIVGRGERGALERHVRGARLFLVRADAPPSTSSARQRRA